MDVEKIETPQVSGTEPTPPATEPGEGAKEPETVSAEITAPPVEEPSTEPSAPKEFDWSQYKNAERLKGRSVQEMIDYLNEREPQYGQQANELGRLRGVEQELNKIREQVSGKAAPEKKEPEFSEVETAMFVQEFNQNPLAAINKYLVPKLSASLQEQVTSHVNEQMGKDIDGRVQHVATQQEFRGFVKDHPEYPEHKDMMSRLMEPDYLGDNAPYEQVLELAKVAKEEPSLFGITCALMQRGVPFTQAKEFASLKQNAAANAETKKDQIKQEVAAASSGLKRSTTKVATTEPEIKTMEDVVASMPV